jgi:hypothetical protein
MTRTKGVILWHKREESVRMLPSIGNNLHNSNGLKTNGALDNYLWAL